MLVIGDDMRIFLAVVRSLGRLGKEVHAAPFNWHSPALKSRYVSTIHYLPRYSDDQVAWLAAMREVLQENEFDLVLPCCDRAILPLHHHRNDFSGVRLAIPSPEEMTLLFDKGCTHDLCKELGIPVVPDARLAAGDTAEGLVARFGLPLVIKPRKSYWIDQLDAYGEASIIESEAELRELLGTLPEPDRSRVEGYFEGVGVGVSVLAQEGKVLQAFQHRRLREGKGTSSSYRVSEPLNEQLLDAAERICKHTRMTGVCMFEFRYNLGSKQWVLLETNARFWGSIGLPLSLGLDFPRFLYDLLVHGVYHMPMQYRPGVRSRNFVLDAFNLLVGLRGLRRGKIAPWLADFGDFLLQPFRWLQGHERSDSFVVDDLAPAFWECALLMKSVTQKFATDHGARPRRRRHEVPADSPAT